MKIFSLIIFWMCAIAAFAQDADRMLRIESDKLEIALTQDSEQSAIATIDIGVANDYQWPEEAIVRADIYCGDELLVRRLANNYLPEHSITTIRFTAPIDLASCTNSSDLTIHIYITSLIGEPYDHISTSI